MSTLTHPVSDCATMVRRNVRHALRYPGMIIMSGVVPVLLLLLFVNVFGGALHTGTASSSPGAYIDYVVPGILLMTVGYGSSMTAMAVNRDMTAGIIARFRTMAISRTSVLVGHVVGALVRTMVSVLLVLAAAVVLGFRPTTKPGRWIAVLGLIALIALALTWLAVPIGLAAKTAEGIGPFTLTIQMLPFISSAFVPATSMSGSVRWFAQHEPFTPIIDTMRSLLMDTPIGANATVAVAWCLGTTLTGYLWARILFSRDPNR
jgi:ABC-2 type transport system permease protein